MFIKPKNDYQNMSDEKLMQAIQNGDCKAFDVLYKRYNERLYYYFFRMLGFEHQVAEDFVQDLFVRIIDKPQRFDVRRKFSTWIFSIAHNMCKNEYRSREVRSIISTTENPDYYIQEEDSKKDNKQHLDTIFKILNQMDESHKTVFLLKYREGFSIEEISDITSLPQGTVKSRLHYARKKIQEKVSPNHSI